MTREQAARWLAVRNNQGLAFDDEYERAYLALTAPYEVPPGHTLIPNEEHTRLMKLAYPSFLVRGEERIAPSDVDRPDTTSRGTPVNQHGPGSLTVAGAIDWDAAYDARHSTCTHHYSTKFCTACESESRTVVLTATRNLKVVRVPTREELAKLTFPSMTFDGEDVRKFPRLWFEALKRADAILALMEGK